MRSEKLKKIIEHYGVNSQLKKLHEEVYELSEAVIEYKTGLCPNLYDKESITEEFADCMVLLMQLKEFFEIDMDSVNEVMDQKIDRQLQRMENEPKTDTTTLKVGDTVKCASPEEMVELMYELQKQGIETDFLYSVNGVRGLYLEVVKVETK